MVVGLFLYGTLVLGSLVLCVAGLLNIQDAFRADERRHAVSSTPVSELESVALGNVAVSGVGRPVSNCLRVPFGGTERSLCHHVTVSDTNKIEGTHVDERTTVPFVLEDGETQVRVDAAELELDLTERRQWSREVASHETLPADLERFTDSRDLPSQGLDRDREFRYEYVPPERELYVYGCAVSSDEADGPAGEKSVTITTTAESRGFISDKPRDRLIDERESVLSGGVARGIVEAVAGLGGFLLLTGVAFIIGI